MKNLKNIGWIVIEANIPEVLEAVRKVYSLATVDSQVEILAEYVDNGSDCAPYGVEGFHRDYIAYRGLWRVDGRLMELRLRSGVIIDHSGRRHFTEAYASAKAGREWLNREKATSAQKARTRKDYGAAAKKAARKYHLPVKVVLAIGPENAKEFSARVDNMSVLPSDVEWALSACGIIRRIRAICFALRLDPGSELMDRIEAMGQIHSKRVAAYVLEHAPKGGAAIAYDSEWTYYV